MIFFTTRCARGHREHRAYAAKISSYKLIFNYVRLARCSLCPLETEGNGWLKLLGSFSLGFIGILFACH